MTVNLLQSGREMDALPAAQRLLTECIDVEMLQTLQDRLSALTGVSISMRDPYGQPITRPSGESDFCRILSSSPNSSDACRASHEHAGAMGACADRPCQTQCHAGLAQFAAPIIVNGNHVGTILMGDRPRATLKPAEVDAIAADYKLDPNSLRAAAAKLHVWSDDEVQPAVDFLQHVATTLAARCYQAVELRDRVDELDVLYRLGSMLADTFDVQEILDKSLQLVTEVLQVKASGCRLLDDDTGELRVAATHNLSHEYLSKGGVSLRTSPIDAEAMEQGMAFIADYPNEPRAIYRDEARREGLVSVLVASMTYRGRSIGVLRVYSDRYREFSDFERSLLSNMASQMAAAIIYARLVRDSVEAERLNRQIAMASDVQRRMIPLAPPIHERLAFGAVYAPSLALSGDFYDFIELSDGRIGVVIADVVGKGVAASLTMASARASLRAHAKNIGSIRDVMTEVNRDICRDTLISEFVTVFYAVFSADGREMSFCNAGHEPPMLLRNGELTMLETGGFILGVDPDVQFEEGTLILEPDDVLMLYTDGLVDGLSFDGHPYGRLRLKQSFMTHAPLPPGNLASQVLWDLRRYRGLAEQTDDISVVTVRVQ